MIIVASCMAAVSSCEPPEGIVSPDKDESDNWEQVNSPRGGSVASLFVAPSGAILAGAYSSLFRTTDIGLTWTELDKPRVRVYSYGSTDSTWFAGTEYDGVYRSEDEGVSWQKSTFPGSSAYALAARPPEL